ncbi:MAG: hypothetical protein HPY50_13645 [Firmicutes bacterium]|nr:hypothetical protein [Bacillota bacterium]
MKEKNVFEELLTCPKKPKGFTATVKCDCCSEEILDGEEVYYDQGVILHFRYECLDRFFSQLKKGKGENKMYRYPDRSIRVYRRRPHRFHTKASVGY